MKITALAVSYLLAVLPVYAWFRDHWIRRSLQTVLNKIYPLGSNNHDSPYSLIGFSHGLWPFLFR
jgi:hypothetical protein